MKRRKHIWYEFNGDGRFPKDRIKGFWKRHWNKWFKRIKDKEMEDEIKVEANGYDGDGNPVQYGIGGGTANSFLKPEIAEMIKRGEKKEDK